MDGNKDKNVNKDQVEVVECIKALFPIYWRTSEALLYTLYVDCKEGISNSCHLLWKSLNAEEITLPIYYG